MPTKEERRVPKKKPLASSQPFLRDWEAARTFLEVARVGSFRAAARTLQQSINSLRRKIDKLEKHFGLPLITRHIDGVRLTAEGTRLLAIVQRMELASQGTLGEEDQRDPSGEVKVAATF